MGAREAGRRAPADDAFGRMRNGLAGLGVDLAGAIAYADVVNTDLTPCSFVVDKIQPVDSLQEYRIIVSHQTEHAEI
jgi:hypothetical protein